MPELPEVENVVKHLAKNISGKVFSDCQIKVSKMVNKNFKKLLKSKIIKKVRRRGKMIIIELSDNKYLLIHLKMTGQLIYVSSKGQIAGGGHPINAKDFVLARSNKFTRIILRFNDGSQLFFHDMRKFGWMKIVKFDDLQKIENQYGIEPLSARFTFSKFKDLLQKKPNLKIKQFLMRQEIIAGIGNIYTDESLFEARVRPERRIKTLKEHEIKKLYQAIKKILKSAISHGGTSVNTFIQPTGERGRFIKKLKVYQRGGKPCVNCRNVLSKIKVGGRGTVFCPHCQK